MTSRLKVPKLGRAAFGFAAIALGLANVVWGEFAAVWQPMPDSVPHRAALAYVVGLVFIASGIGVQTRRFAKPALVMLGSLFFMFGVLWLPRVFLLPRVYGTYGGVFEEFSVVAAALLAYASLPDMGPATVARLSRGGGASCSEFALYRLR